MIELLLDHLPWFWFFLVIVFALIECFTMGLTTIWFALGAVVMIFLSLTPLPFIFQILLFLIVSSALLFFTRPVAIKLLKTGRENTNTDNVIGKKAVVIKSISKFDKGEIKCGGIIWTARTDDDTSLEVDSECTIIRIEGVTAIVAPYKQDSAK